MFREHPFKEIAFVDSIQPFLFLCAPFNSSKTEKVCTAANWHFKETISGAMNCVLSESYFSFCILFNLGS